MFVGCQAFEDLYSVLRQIEFLQFLQLIETTQSADPVILRDVKKNWKRYKLGEVHHT